MSLGATDAENDLTPEDADSGVLDDTAAPEVPTWYVVRAALSIEGGLAVPTGAEVTVDIVDADLERVNCSFSLAIDALDAAPESPGEGVWWELPVDAPNDACAALPASLILGVGALPSDVRARLGSVGLDDVADSLYGAWILPDGAESPSAFGYAGTAADLAGDDAAALPPPDGAYTLSPLFLLALPG